MTKVASLVILIIFHFRAFSQYFTFNTTEKFRSSYCNVSITQADSKKVKLLQANSGAAVVFVKDMIFFNTNTLLSAWDLSQHKILNYKIINTSRGYEDMYNPNCPNGKKVYASGSSYSDAKPMPTINGHKPLLMYARGDTAINFSPQSSFWASVENIDNNTIYFSNSAYYYFSDYFYDIKQNKFISHKDNTLKPINTGDILGGYGSADPMDSKKGQYIQEFLTKSWVEPYSYYFETNSILHISKMKIESATAAVNRRRRNYRTTGIPEIDLPTSGKGFEHSLRNASINYPSLYFVYEATPIKAGNDSKQRHFIALDLNLGKIASHIQADEFANAELYNDIQNPWHYFAASEARNNKINGIADVQDFTLTQTDKQPLHCNKENKYTLATTLTGLVNLNTSTGQSVKLFLRENEQFLLAASVNKSGKYAAVIIGTKGSDPAFKDLFSKKQIDFYYTSYYLLNLKDGNSTVLYDESMYNSFQKEIKNLSPLNFEKIIMYEKMN